MAHGWRIFFYFYTREAEDELRGGISCIGWSQHKSEYVSFSGTSVTVSCGENRVNNGIPLPTDENPEAKKTLTEPYDENNPVKYSCDTGAQPFKFYIKAKVCKDCYELDGSLVAGVICGDLLITGGIILLVYLYGQRKSGPAPQKPTNARRTAGSGSGPPVPSPDYQPLSDFTRSKDTYATVNKTG